MLHGPFGHLEAGTVVHTSTVGLTGGAHFFHGGTENEA